MRCFRSATLLVILAFAGIMLCSPTPAVAASAAQISYDATVALKNLYATTPSAKILGQTAKAILVFPNIVKGGFIVGGQYGEGALLRDGKPVAYYNTVAASYGLQAGIQKYGYAVFFMTESMIKYLDKSDGWELGLAPNIVVADVGAAGGVSTTTAQSDVYAFFFDQKGLMAGLGLQGTKITRIEK